MSITLDEAQRVLNRAIEIAREQGARVAIAVVDDHAVPVALARLDGARPHVPAIALGKAMASAIWERKSSDLVEAGMTSPRQVVNSLHGGRVVYASGAVPLKRDGVVVGAVGVGGGGGGSGDEDIALAAAAEFGS